MVLVMPAAELLQAAADHLVHQEAGGIRGEAARDCRPEPPVQAAWPLRFERLRSSACRSASGMCMPLAVLRNELSRRPYSPFPHAAISACMHCFASRAHP